MPTNGIFVLAELGGEAGELISRIQEEYDPKLAASYAHPHVTLAGSSGVGPIPPDIPVDVIRDALAPIAASTAPLSLPFQPPLRFMQREIIVLPLDPHGAIRQLHDKILGCGLPFERARYPFTPHATLSLFPTHPPEVLKRLLNIRVTALAEMNALTVYHTRDPQPATRLFDLPLTWRKKGDHPDAS